MKKVLIVSTVTLRNNGITSILMGYLSNMNTSNFQIDFAACGIADDIIVDKLKKNNINFILLPYKKKIFSYIKEIKRVIKYGNYDVIHVNGQSSMMFLELLYAKKYGCKKRIAHSHNTSTSHKIINKICMRFLDKNYNYALACSKEAGQWLFHGNKFEILNNGIDIEKFRFDFSVRAKVRKELLVNDDCYLIGHVGIFNEQKNQLFLLDVFNEYTKINNDSKLLLIGYGNKDKIYEKITALQLKDRVIVLDSQNNIQDYYCAMDIFVLPSKWEGFGIVNVEAQANSLPCLNSTAVALCVKCSDRYFRLDLKKGANVWANEIENIRNHSFSRDDDFSCEIKKSGFDIKEEAVKLEKIYNS